MKTFCLQCAAAPREDNFPKTCSICGVTSFINPLPVAVVPVKGKGFLLPSRYIAPQIGQLTFIGGFVNKNETIEKPASHEAMKEVGVVIDPKLTEAMNCG